MKENIGFIDWGPWEVNPFIINNICINNQKLYFIDFGDCIFDKSENIEKYFNLQIWYIEKLVECNILFIIYFYLNKIYFMFYRNLLDYPLDKYFNNILCLFIFIKKSFLFINYFVLICYHSC